MIWTRVLLMCLMAQSALGCVDLHSALCETDIAGAHEDRAPDDDRGACDLACAHCHGGCVHSALPVQRAEPLIIVGTCAPEAKMAHWRTGSTQHPLLRPPALPA